MAVPIEFASVILRKRVVDAEVTGGLDAISQADLANWAEDEHLVRIGFMNPNELAALLDRFFPAGDSEEAVAVVLSNEPTGPVWLSFGSVDGAPAAWLAGTEPGPLVSPMGVSHLYQLRDGTGWAELMQVVATRGIQVSAVHEDSRVLSRGDASVDAWLIERQDGDVVLILAQRIARRRWFNEDGELMREITSTTAAMLDAKPWP